MNEELNNDELDCILGWFPGLNGHQAFLLKTDNENEKYNCIAWSLGFTDIWIDPPSSQDLFRALCKYDPLLNYQIIH